MQNIQLSIPEPCHEHWQDMSPAAQGRFCNSCAKVVIDFSTMTDIEVLNYFSSLKNEKVCGRVLPDQLNKPISRPAQPKKKLFWYWNYITLFFLFFSKSPVKAQITVGKMVSVPVKRPPVNIKMGMMATGPHIQQATVIAGKITNTYGRGIPFATIREKGTPSGTTTDEYGVYKLKVTGLLSIVEISAAGFATKEFSLAGLRLYNFTLAANELQPTMGEVAIISTVCNTVKGGISVNTKKITNDTVRKTSPVKMVFNKIVDTIGLVFTTSPGKIFPNPIQRGNSIQLILSIKQTGIYNIQVVEPGGRIVMTNQVNIRTKDLAEKILVGSNWGIGNYFIVVSDNNNKQVYKNSFIVL